MNRVLKIENRCDLSKILEVSYRTRGYCECVSIQTYSVIERCSTSIRVDLKRLTRVVTNAWRRASSLPVNLL